MDQKRHHAVMMAGLNGRRQVTVRQCLFPLGKSDRPVFHLFTVAGQSHTRSVALAGRAVNRRLTPKLGLGVPCLFPATACEFCRELRFAESAQRAARTKLNWNRGGLSFRRFHAREKMRCARSFLAKPYWEYGVARVRSPPVDEVETPDLTSARISGASVYHHSRIQYHPAKPVNLLPRKAQLS